MKKKKKKKKIKKNKKKKVQLEILPTKVICKKNGMD